MIGPSHPPPAPAHQLDCPPRAPSPEPGQLRTDKLWAPVRNLWDGDGPLQLLILSAQP